MGAEGKGAIASLLAYRRHRAARGHFLNRDQTGQMAWFFATRDYPQAAGHLHEVLRYTTTCRPWTTPTI